MHFESLNIIEPILKSLKEEGYTKPTPIQIQAIPIVLKGTDLIGCAQTGTGKTAAFAVPIIQLLYNDKTFDRKKKIRSLIVTPTRELAIQIRGEFQCIWSAHRVIMHGCFRWGTSESPGSSFAKWS